MKMNQAVLSRVYKMRARKGFKTTDTNSLFYKVSKFLYFASFLWYSFNLFITAFGWTVLYNDFVNVKKVTNLFHIILVWILLAATITAVVLIFKKKHEIGACCNLAFVTTGLVLFDFYLRHYQRGIDDGYITLFGKQLLLDYVWKVFAPAMLMYLFCAVMCVIAFKEKHSLRKDYETVLEALYVGNKEKFHSGSEEEWEALLESLDDAEVENQLDKYHTEQYLKRKAENKKKNEKAE